MMQFDPSIPFLWLCVFIGIIFLILLFQVWSIFISNISKKQKIVKIILHAFLSLSLIGFLVHPTWRSEMGSDPVLVHPKSFPSEQINFFKDSLGIRKSFAIDQFKGQGNPVYLIGNDYSNVELNKLSSHIIQRVPAHQDNELAFLTWKGIVRKGEVQKIKGKIHDASNELISLKMQDQLIESDSLVGNDGDFEMEFPVSVLGRNSLQLYFGENLVSEIRFFALPPSPKSYSLLFSFPNPESRILSTFLSSQGEKVEDKIQVSRGAIIQTSGSDLDSAKVLIGDLDQLKSSKATDQLNEGAVSLLVMNLSNPTSDIKAINDYFKTEFEVKKSTDEEFRKLESGIEVLPYEFAKKPGMEFLFDQSVAIQNLDGQKVGVSLISQTFPLYLSGDSVSYSNTWQLILSKLSPIEAVNWSYEAPVFQNQPLQIQLNQFEKSEGFTSLGNDTINFQQDLINPFTQFSNLMIPDSGWVSLADSLEVFVYSEDALVPIQNEKKMAGFFQNQSEGSTSISYLQKSVSDWIWLAVFLFAFGLLWLEPRINY